jgi:Na+-transporting methylmalonyl-CoA/oxaloacetate decarboxylase gamma subunit
VANVLGVVGIFVFIAVIISLAAGVTWVVVRFSPNPNKKRESASSTST